MLWCLHWNLWKILEDHERFLFPSHSQHTAAVLRFHRRLQELHQVLCTKHLQELLGLSSKHQCMSPPPMTHEAMRIYADHDDLWSMWPSSNRRKKKYLKGHLCNLLLCSLCMDCFCDGFGLTKAGHGGSTSRSLRSFHAAPWENILFSRHGSKQFKQTSRLKKTFTLRIAVSDCWVSLLFFQSTDATAFIQQSMAAS